MGRARGVGEAGGRRSGRAGRTKEGSVGLVLGETRGQGALASGQRDGPVSSLLRSPGSVEGNGWPRGIRAETGVVLKGGDRENAMLQDAAEGKVTV